jgi:hypothetical protein
MAVALIGRWTSDPTDVEGIREFGRAHLEFFPDGTLIYTAVDESKQQKMFLTYRVEGGVLITDQPSAPREERTPFTLTAEGKLTVTYGGLSARYVSVT